MQAQILDRPVEDDLSFLDRKTRSGHRIGNVAGRNRAVQLPALAGLADDDDGKTLDFAADFRRLGPALQVVGFELSALGLEIGQILFCCAHRFLLGQQIVPRVTGLHFNELTHLAELLDPLEQDQFDHSHSSKFLKT